MKKVVQYLIIAILLYSIVSFLAPQAVYALECTDDAISKLPSMSPGDAAALRSKCDEALASIEKAVKPHKDELDRMNRSIAAFQARIKTIEADVARKSTAIAEGEKELEGFLSIASDKIRRFYIRSFTTNPMALLLSSMNIGSVLRTIGYQQAAINEDKKVITQTAMSVKDLEDKKKTLEGEKATLASLKASTDRSAEVIRKLVGEAQAYESKVQGYIAAISARQEEFLGQKLAGLGIPLFAMSGGGCSSDLTNGKNPGFDGGFGFFTFGVPNRVGLNQYGAFGRANAGQNADTILRAYYNFDSYQNFDNITIKVNDSPTRFNEGNVVWSGSLNDYVKRIYEVPGNWPYESIKAQVIAVRSYVLAATNNGAMSICATQYCQVFQSNPKGGTWEQAVNDSGGQVMVQGGQPIKAFFSSTHGGYEFNTGDLQNWSATSYTKRMIDTPNGSVSSFSELRSNAFDKDSPWFYCDWGGRSSYGGTAWLKSDEVADIVNVILLARRDSSTLVHLYQSDKPNPQGQETWDAGRVKSELGSDAFHTITDVSVDWDRGTGRTTSVHVSGDAGSHDFDGVEFRKFFSLRAPANIQIVGPLFNVEKK